MLHWYPTAPKAIYSSRKLATAVLKWTNDWFFSYILISWLNSTVWLKAVSKCVNISSLCIFSYFQSSFRLLSLAFWDFAPRPNRNSASGPRWGTFVPQTSSFVLHSRTLATTLVGTTALSYFLYTACRSTSIVVTTVTYNLLLKILNRSFSFTGVGIIVYNVLLCGYEVTHALVNVLIRYWSNLTGASKMWLLCGSPGHFAYY